MSLVLSICHIIRLYKCEHCTLTCFNKVALVLFLVFFLGGRWFSKILRNIWGWCVKILTIPYRGGWVVWKRPKTPLRNIKMAPNASMISSDQVTLTRMTNGFMNKLMMTLWLAATQSEPSVLPQPQGLTHAQPKSSSTMGTTPVLTPWALPHLVW